MKKFIIISLLFHGSIGLFFFLYQNGNFFSSKSISESVLKDAVRVDIVGMPTKTLNELKQLQLTKKSPVTKSEAVESKEVPSTAKEKEEEVFSKEAKVKSKEKDTENKKKVKKGEKSRKIEIKGLDELVLMGNQISKGASLDSENISDEALAMLDEYASKVRERVKSLWELPTNLLKNEELKCEVVLFINKEGKLVKTQFLSKSSNEEYNKIVLDTLKRAQPFGKPDPEISGALAKGKLLIKFPF